MQNVLCRLRCETSPPNSPGPRVPEQGVEVGAVDVHLAAVVVHDLAELGDGVLVDAVRRRVGHHDRGEPLAVRLALRAQVVEVDRAVRGRLDHDDLHAGHHGGGGVGAVGRRRDQADVAALVAVGQVVAADRQQPGELTLRARVRLDRDSVVAGHLGQPRLQVGDQLLVAQGVLGGRERVQVGEAGQRHRLHLGGRVELHRARAERDHAAVERVVAGAEAAQVAQHLRLAAVRREDLVGEVRRGATQRGGDRVVGVGVEGLDVARDAERLEHAARRGPRGGLRRGEADPVGVDEAQVEAESAGGGDDLLGAARGPERSGCRRSSRARPRAHPLAAPRRARRRSGGCGSRSPAVPRGRGRRRTSRRPPRAAPGRCRCWRSPCRGGCAARGSAARAGSRAGPRRRPRPRPGGRAGGARGRRATAMKPACGPP